MQLKEKFDVLYAELNFYSTGQKPEDIEKASTRLQLACQELETQQNLMKRNDVKKDLAVSMKLSNLDQSPVGKVISIDNCR